jgi:hypothetical protein
MFCLQPDNHLWLYAVIALSLVLGVMAGDADRRRRHAGGDLAAEQLLGPRGLRGGLRINNMILIVAGALVGASRHHPDADHVQGDEPFARQRAVRRLRRGDGPRTRRTTKSIKSADPEETPMRPRGGLVAW